MVQARPQPPSPPSSAGGELVQHNLHQLAHHNSATSFSTENFEYDGRNHLIPGSDSSLAISAPIYHHDDYLYSSYPYQQRYQEAGLGNQYDEFSSEASHYRLMHGDQLFSSQYCTPAGSPPTASMPTPLSDIMRTRSGLTVNRPIQTLKPLPQSRARQQKLVKVKRAKKDKAKADSRVPKLEKPLSELTKEWNHVPIVDIEAYVNRPAEQRRKEVEDGKIPGKVKRPMNSFMLYRKAYQNRTKNWCLQNNHQVVSQVCGDSWPLEPEAVRDQFNEWSKIERINHQNAHPGYKFSPSKGTIVKPQKRKKSLEPDSDESEVDEFDWEGEELKRNNKRSRSLSRPVESKGFLIAQNNYGYSREQSKESSFGSHNKSSYQVTNPGKVPPAQYSQSSLVNGQYYQQRVHQNGSNPGLVEDILIKKTAAPGISHLGLPGGHTYALTGQYPPQEDDMILEDQIDPSLVAHDNLTYSSSYVDQESMYLGDNFNDDTDWQTYGKAERDLYHDPQDYVGTPQNFDGLHINSQQLQMLRANQEAWSVEPLDMGKEFDKWMDEV